jgi:hypothetical protein
VQPLERIEIMKTVKTISINGTTYGLPEGMASKDIQALAGFLCTFTAMGSEYNYDDSEYVHYTNGGVTVQVSDSPVLDKADARQLGEQSRLRYQARRDAEERARAGDLVGLHVNQ